MGRFMALRACPAAGPLRKEIGRDVRRKATGSCKPAPLANYNGRPQECQRAAREETVGAPVSRRAAPSRLSF
jgi:hypothetical protein